MKKSKKLFYLAGGVIIVSRCLASHKDYYHRQPIFMLLLSVRLFSWMGIMRLSYVPIQACLQVSLNDESVVLQAKVFGDPENRGTEGQRQMSCML